MYASPPRNPYDLLSALVEAYRRNELHRPKADYPLDVRALLKALNTHCFEAGLMLGAIERRCGLNDHNVSRRFAEHVGGSPRTYRRRHRMELAKRLLRHEGLQTIPVAQIALTVGYERPDSFARAFKRYTGCAPKQYRKAS
jgi:AraC-like DNA-binding protein